MLQVDLHSHTLFSRCGLHTILEMLNQARALGLEALAITDHGLTLGGHLNGPFFDRLQDPVPGVKLLKGVECNVLNDGGHIDLPMQWIQHLDVVLVGLHPNLKEGPPVTTAYHRHVGYHVGEESPCGHCDSSQQSGLHGGF